MIYVINIKHEERKKEQIWKHLNISNLCVWILEKDESEIEE
jgi:hypothetical protein